LGIEQPIGVIMLTKRVYNFNPGPATLPLPALEQAQKELLNYGSTGMSIMEISHRSKEYDRLHNQSTDLVKELLNISDEFTLLWLQGGASTQFFMVPVNLKVKGKPLEYVNTGVWSKKAIKEAKLYGEVNVVASSNEDFTDIPNDISFHDDASYAHITSNNTIYGTQFQSFPKVPEDVPMVCDMSSDIMSRAIDIKKFGVIYAGAQKNIGPAGVTLVIVRKDLLDRVDENAPTMQKWITQVNKNSLFNTAPTWTIYMCKLCLDFIKKEGGILEIEKRNKKKAAMLYDLMDTSNGFYKGHADPDSRSYMNVTFNLPTEELEKECVQQALDHHLIGLKGHRSVGGMRASIYNAMSVEGVKTLVEFLQSFQEEHQ
jgi:phosphoserine aminotransferase